MMAIALRAAEIVKVNETANREENASDALIFREFII